MREIALKLPHLACIALLTTLALGGCRSQEDRESADSQSAGRSGTPKIVLGIGMSPIDNAGSDAFGIPRGHGWLVTEVRGNEPPALIQESFSNSQLEQHYRDVRLGRIPPDAALEQAHKNWEAVAQQTRATRDAMRLVERDAQSTDSKWSVFGESGRISLGDMILSVDGRLVGPSVNDGNNIVGSALAGRPPGYKYKIEGLRISSEALDRALVSPAASAALMPEKFEAWFVVP